MEKLRRRHNTLVQQTESSFKRYLMEKLPWDERLIGIKGSRGVGKTTLLLQYIKEHYQIDTKALYLAMDDLYFTDNDLLDLVEEFVTKGGEHLFIDEVHKYKNWSIALKQIHDTYQNLRVVFTGSSLLEILNSRSDLSRRALVYEMQGLSFREFLNFNLKTGFEKLQLKEILENHIEISAKISAQIKPLKEFEIYLKVGYFPFYNGNQDLYHKRILEIVNMILEIELPTLRNTDISIVSKIKQLLYIVSQSVPFKPNITSLANKIQITRKTLLEYLNYLNEAKLFHSIHKNTHGIGALQKPEKLFLNNTNYIYAIMEETPEMGNLRETFFLSQLSAGFTVTYPEFGDFLIDNTFTFEIGGKNKTTKQISEIPNAFVAADDIEIGFENKIPLWLFGFLY